MKAHSEKGFTLVELLVVLALVASISGLFLDPIARVYDLKARLSAFIDKAPDNILPPSWFQKTVKGYYPGEDKFEGTANRFSGETIMSFDEPQGVPMPFAWEISYNADTGLSTLSYLNAIEEPQAMLTWRGDSGSFSYFDEDTQKWVDEWQSSPFVKKEDYRLPSLIRFEAERDGKVYMIQAAFEQSRTGEKDILDSVDRMMKELREKQGAAKEEDGGDDLPPLERTPPKSKASLPNGGQKKAPSKEERDQKIQAILDELGLDEEDLD